MRGRAFRVRQCWWMEHHLFSLRKRAGAILGAERPTRCRCSGHTQDGDMTVCYLPKPSSPLANNIALPTSTMHHALTHSSLYGSLFLLPANLRSFAPTISRSSRRSPTHHQRYRTTTHTSKTAHLTFSLYGLRRRRAFLFPSTDLPASPGRGEEIGRLIY